MKHLKYLTAVIVGNFILAFSVYAFLVPYDIVVGGATGLSIFGEHVFHINMSTIVLIINLICLPLGYIFVGKEVVIGSILSSFIYPIALSIAQNTPGISSISDSIMLSTIAGGATAGIGIGLVIRAGASTGGMDIPPIILNKKFHLSISTTMYAIDTCIMLSQLVYADPSRVIYGIIYTYVMTFMIDKVLTLGVDKYQITVITEKYEELRKTLIQNDVGVTMSFIETGLQEKQQKSVISTFHSRQLRRIQTIIEEVDPAAFVTIQKVTDVRGRGFTIDKDYQSK